MLEKGTTRDEICCGIYQYAEANDKYMKNQDENKEESYLMYSDVNNLYVWAMSQIIPLGGFKQVEEICHFNEALMKSYNDDSTEGYFLEFDVQYPEGLSNLDNDLPF